MKEPQPVYPPPMRKTLFIYTPANRARLILVAVF